MNEYIGCSLGGRLDGEGKVGNRPHSTDAMKIEDAESPSVCNRRSELRSFDHLIVQLQTNEEAVGAGALGSFRPNMFALK